jgi:hypothetical protein
MLLVMKILKWHPLYVVGVLNTVLTAWAVGLTSVAQVGSYGEKTVTPEEVHPYPRTTTNVSASGRQLRGKKRIPTLDT